MGLPQQAPIQHIFMANQGQYTVQLIGYGPCGNDTTTQTLIFENTSGIGHQDGLNNTYIIKRINENTYEIVVNNNQSLF